MKKLILFCLLIILTYNAYTQAIIDRGPYLQLATENSIIIKWRTEEPTKSIVSYGSEADNLNLNAQNTGTTTDHEVQLNGLSANTYYYYAVGDSTGILSGGDPTFRFKTNPIVGSETSFLAWVQGDPGTGGEVQRATRDGFYAYLGERELDLMLVLGDNAYSDGKQSEFQDAFFENMYEDLINKVVVWPTIGNHDSHSANSDEESGPYYDIFTLPKNGEAGGTPSGTEAYYSYDYANTHFVVLNSVDIDRSATSPMAEWLANDLASTNQDWIVAYFHHPIYSGANDNESDFGNQESDMRENFLPLLEAHDVDLILFGDTHNYQRSFMVKGHYGVSATFDTLTMAADYSTGRLSDNTPYSKFNQGDGAVFVVTGSAGKLEGEDPENLQHPTMVTGMDELGSLSLEINGTQLDGKFILQDGSVADHFTIIKAPNPLDIQITNPADGAYFPTTQNINISTAVTGGATEVSFYINGALIGTDYAPPFHMNWHSLFPGSFTVKAIASDVGNFTKSATVNIQIGQSTTTCVQIKQSTDDAEERENGSMNLTSSDLELIADGNNDQVVGLRFTEHNIPHGIAINDAYLTFNAKSTNNDNPSQLIISGQIGNNTTTFEQVVNNISSRPRTNALATWNPSDWSNTTDEQVSVNIGSILQEIILQENYTPEDPIIIIIEGTGRRHAISFDYNSDKAPGLCFSYDAAICLDSDFDGTCDVDDICAGGIEPGQPCDDNSSETYDDIITNNCICQGTYYNCPDLSAQIGDPCDDGDNTTFGDIVNTACECIGIPYDCPNLQLQFGTPCDDNNIYTFDDFITTDCECVGTPYDCPDLQMQFGSLCNDNNPFTCYDIITTDCECTGTPTTSSSIISGKINQDNDDAEERNNGSINVGSSDLELIRDGTVNQVVGLRFTGMGIAPGTTLTSAYVQFTVDETKNTNPCNLTIYGELNTNAPAFTTTTNNISDRTKTTTSISWSPNDWTGVDDNGPDQQTPDIAPIIQEIIDQSGYTSASSFVLIIEGQGRRVAVARDGNINDAPELIVSYSNGLDDNDGDGICDDEDQCFGPEPGAPCDDNNPGTYNDVLLNTCDCLGTWFECPDLAGDIGDSCDDGSSATFNDYINANCECTGFQFECPTLGANIGDPCDDSDPQTSNDLVDTNCNCVGDPPVEVQICDQVSASSDDAEERSNGSINKTSSDLELTEDKGDEQVVGMRFTSLNLQQGAFISQAFLQFKTDKDNNINPCNLTIHGELSTNPATFENISENISSRTKTSASVSWSPVDWENTGDAGPGQQSTDISSIIQEIVNQENFGPTSPVVITISGEGLRQAVAYDEDDQGAPILCITTVVPASEEMTILNNASFNQGVQNEISTQEDNSSSFDLNFDDPNKLYLNVYPNPAKIAITATFNMLVEGKATLSILNTDGITLLKEEVMAERNKNKLLVQTASLPSGVYFLTLQTAVGRRVAKFSIIE